MLALPDGKVLLDKSDYDYMSKAVEDKIALEIENHLLLTLIKSISGDNE